MWTANKDQVSRLNQAVAVFRDTDISALSSSFEFRRYIAEPAASGHAGAGTGANMVRPGGLLYGLWRDILDPEHRIRNSSR